MSTAASAVTTVDSATTQQPEFDPTNQHTWSAEQRDEWNRTGDIPAPPKKSDSATDKTKNAAADSAPHPNDKKEKTADSASDSATDKESKPHLKSKEDTEKRINELLASNKEFQRQIDELKRAKASDTRDSKQESQPAAEVYKPLDEKEFFKANPKASYEDWVRAAAKHEAKWEARQEIALENQRRATEAAQRELSTRVEEAKKRYPDFDQRIQPAVKAITEDQQIPHAVKAVINDSPDFVDLMYVLAEPKALADLIHTAKTNPAAAIRKIVLTEQLVQAELAKMKAGGNGADKSKSGEATSGADGKTRDASGKFVSAEASEKKDGTEPKPRAPKPPSEVGGRGTAGEDELRRAAASGNFRDFEAEQTRRMKARLQG